MPDVYKLKQSLISNLVDTPPPPPIPTVTSYSTFHSFCLFFSIVSATSYYPPFHSICLFFISIPFLLAHLHSIPCLFFSIPSVSSSLFLLSLLLPHLFFTFFLSILILHSSCLLFSLLQSPLLHCFCLFGDST